MEKRKIDMSKAHDIYESKELKVGDEVFTIRTHIPYEQKMALANEWVELTVVSNEDLGICYDVGNAFVRLFLIVKYYTDIDVTDVPMEDVYDYLVNMNAAVELERIVADDFAYTYDIYAELSGAVQALFEAEHSLSQLAKNILGGKLDLQNEETRELIEKLIDMKAAYDKEQDKNNVLQFAKKKPAVGGLNFKKK